MSTGIRAELSFEDGTSCRVARLTGEAGVDTESISRSVAPETGRVTEEFVVEGNGDLADPEVEQVFSYGDRSIYRFTRDQDKACPCETVEQFGSPVVDVHTDDGVLQLAVHVEDMDELQAVVGDVRTRFPDVSIDRLVRSQPDGDTTDLVLVNRGELTPRQREVIETAHRLGYFQHPKGANAGEVAEELGITTSTFTEHLAAAQSKLLSAILG
jgi:hypothetical protein